MSYQREREDFIVRMTREGLDRDIVYALLRAATTLNRIAELECSSEWHMNHDRVPCPAIKSHYTNDCCCDRGSDPAAPHVDVPRVTVRAHRLERRLRAMVAAVGGKWGLVTAGDPRGYVLRVVPPSYAQRNKGRDRDNLDSIGVPNGPSGLRF